MKEFKKHMLLKAENKNQIFKAKITNFYWFGIVQKRKL